MSGDGFGWSLPDRPDHPIYREIAEHIAAVEDPSDRLLLGRRLMEADYYAFNLFGTSMRDWRIEDPAHKNFGQLWIQEPYAFDLCREFQHQVESDYEISHSLWWNLPRLHLKTTLITQHGTEWELLNNPSLCFALLVYKVDKVGEAMFDGLRKELCENPVLRAHWPDILTDAMVKTSTNARLTVNRQLGPREPSLSLHSIFTPPTSGHYDRMLVDDPVTKEAVRTAASIEECLSAMKDLTALESLGQARKRFIGTIWDLNGPWRRAEKEGNVVRHKWKRRCMPEDADPWDCWIHGNPETPQFLSTDKIVKWKREYGTYKFQCQLRNNPTSRGKQSFQENWLRYYQKHPMDEAQNGIIYGFLDVGGGKYKDQGDFSTLVTIKLGEDGNRYVLDMQRERYDLNERAKWIFGCGGASRCALCRDARTCPWGPGLHRKWRWKILFVEEFGADSNLAAIEAEMDVRSYHFLVQSLPKTKIPKSERIEKLLALHENGEFLYPKEGFGHGSVSTGNTTDVLEQFKDEEYRMWTPDAALVMHDDLLDGLAWSVDDEVEGMLQWPEGENPLENDPYFGGPDRTGKTPPSAWVY